MKLPKRFELKTRLVPGYNVSSSDKKLRIKNKHKIDIDLRTDRKRELQCNIIGRLFNWTRIRKQTEL